MCPEIEKEINRLVEKKILQPVESCDWATPIVPVLKANGEVRICGDYKLTVNPNIIINRHPIPRVRDLITKLKKGCIFSKLDMSWAYLQVELDDATKEMTTITTHKGLFRPNRMFFGVASAPGLFQSEMEKVLDGIEGVVVFFDDICISGATIKEHDLNLREVLTRLKKCGLKINPKKCFFAKQEVNFLGYKIDKNGIYADKKKLMRLVE